MRMPCGYRITENPKGTFYMKNMIKTAGLCLVLLALLLTVVSCKSGPANAEGTCGDDIDWSYDSDDKSLSLTGSGEMADYDSATDVPWASVIAYVESIEVGEDISTVSDYAFYGASALTEVSLPDSLATIGDYAFAFCGKLENADLPTSLTAIGDSAFEGCHSLKAAFVPASVSSLGSRAFALCSGATEAAILGDVTIKEQTFYYCSELDNLLLSPAIGEDDVDETAFEKASVDFDDAKFAASATAAASVTVHYVDESGETVFEDEVKADIPYNGSFSIVSPVKEGYTADKLTVSGHVYGTDLSYTVTYTKDAVEEETEAPETTEKEKEPISTTTVIGIIIFAVVMIAIGVGAFLLVRADKKAKAAHGTVRKNDKNGKKK